MDPQKKQLAKTDSNIALDFLLALTTAWLHLRKKESEL
jgi:hypothetical protein